MTTIDHKTTPSTARPSKPASRAPKPAPKRRWPSRGVVQAAATLLTNVHLPNFFTGRIYTGNLKYACVPGLNCYSCPGATGACPIGAIQAVTGSSKFSFPYYVVGILIFLGVMLGRFICGFLCPFGWLQDLLHRIPSPKLSTRRLKALRYLKYVILVVVVGIMPVVLVDASGMGAPYFCKYICPQGILEGGIPLAIADPRIRATLGPLFVTKVFVLLTIVTLAVFFYRPFCKWLCPLGAIYSLFNKVSFLQYRVDGSKCVACGKCARTCRMDVDITKCATDLECIRCGECVSACPTKAISIHWGWDNAKGAATTPSPRRPSRP